MPLLPALDKFMDQLLGAFLKAQREAYMETMKQDDPNIAKVQATYECANLAFSALARFVTDAEAQLPEPWQKALETVHDLICATGDDWLRTKGYKPEDF